MADPSESTTHGLYLSGNFEVEKKISPENGWRVEYRTYAISLAAGGAHRSRPMRYEIQAKGFSQANFKLEAGKIYFLRGSFFPSNTDNTKDDVLFFEASDRVLVGQAEDFPGSMVNSVGVTGVGIVTDIAQMKEPRTNGCKPNPADAQKVVTVVTVLHSDYHPTAKGPKQCTVQYRIPPTPNLAGTPKILQKGREYQFHGFLKDFDEETCVYIVIASKVSPTTGSREYDVGGNSEETKEEEDIVVKPSNKLMKFTPKAVNAQFKSPFISPDSESASTLEFPPANYSPSSFLPASAQAAAGGSNSSSDTASSSLIPTPPMKKKGRAQPKRTTKRAKTLDLTAQE